MKNSVKLSGIHTIVLAYSKKVNIFYLVAQLYVFTFINLISSFSDYNTVFLLYEYFQEKGAL